MSTPNLRPETIEYLKKRRIGLATRMSDRSLARNGGMRRHRFMGRSRLYLGKSLLPVLSPRATEYYVYGKENLSANRAQNGARGAFTVLPVFNKGNVKHLFAQKDPLPTFLGSRYIRKDDGGLSVGDVHIPSALGGTTRRRRPKLSLARLPYGQLIRET